MHRLIEPLEKTTHLQWIVYILFYFCWGLVMNWIGQELEIAKFTYWWQVITTYVLYMVPISILLRPYPVFTQYAYGLIAMGLLEFGGYALQTSYIYPDNILERWFGPHVFALCMTLFFAWYFTLGNYVVNRIFVPLIDKTEKNN
ncbi:hypothetical protein [Altibacter sp. HG106]|uniref:hypothetical protein n=1 Tax=Altibacter sp. HG106 TaxID=3023937 RepID=UPI002350096E|nr:hypothetical protein [Altibacter sp. HG106]MDC7994599.1 hypothetical protein [Altibacter sp. HG106]